MFENNSTSYVVLSSDNRIIQNIISANGEYAEKAGCVSWYEGAEIGGLYNPPITRTVEEIAINAEKIAIENGNKLDEFIKMFSDAIRGGVNSV